MPLSPASAGNTSGYASARPELVEEPALSGAKGRAEALRNFCLHPSPAVVQVYLGLGTNLGDRIHNLKRALRLLEPDCGSFACSSVYETPPWGDPDQPPFLNMVVRGQTRLSAAELLRRLKEVETRVGRRPSHRWGPRVIDLDLLAYGDQIVDEPELQVPHPHLHERGFVLVPLADLAPNWRHPALRQTATELLARLPSRETADIERIGTLAEA
ncbi:MAG: 2-amino-4-hydroxy-6-hydroxymethyldihydropteridine diphosphokinase [Chloroflexi bacterium]|nr:2-amino-4-hydroxy-6-hydroxymethyldihydropteridine diphosphokinase [Chloroflexota bacterium]